jgi:hypothetical protein
VKKMTAKPFSGNYCFLSYRQIHTAFRITVSQVVVAWKSRIICSGDVPKSCSLIISQSR